MKKVMTTTIAAGLVASVATAGVDVTMDFVSAYVYRGDTFLDGASFQPGIEASGLGMPEAWGSVAVGAWGSVDLEGDNSSTFQETDWYASYGLPTFVDGLGVSLGYTEYAYAAGDSDKEMSVGLDYAIAGVGLFAGYYQGVGGNIGSSMYIDFGAGYDIEITEELGASVGARAGYLDPSDSVGGESGFKDFDISASISYALTDVWSASASVMYIGQLDDEVLVDVEDGGTYDVDFVFGAGVAASF